MTGCHAKRQLLANYLACLERFKVAEKAHKEILTTGTRHGVVCDPRKELKQSRHCQFSACAVCRPLPRPPLLTTLQPSSAPGIVNPRNQFELLAARARRRDDSSRWNSVQIQPVPWHTTHCCAAQPGSGLPVPRHRGQRISGRRTKILPLPRQAGRADDP